MKILYIENARIPTEKAHGYQICKMCEQFSSLGNQVELWISNRKNNIKQDAFTFYNLKNNFKIKTLGLFDWFVLQRILGSWSFKLQSLFFFINLIFKFPDKKSIIYTRNPEIVWLFKYKKYKVIFSAHNWPQSKIKLFKFFINKVDYIICNSNGTAQEYIDNNFNNVLVAPNGVDLDKFNIIKDKQNLRQKLDLLPDEKIIMYLGHLYKWKGIDVIINASKKIISNKNIIFIVIGGTDADIKKYKKIIEKDNLNNILILGYKSHRKIPQYLKSADILLLPNIANTQESIKYTSPIKMFEYMASGVPVIASNLSSIKEILDDNSAVFFEADNPKDLAEKIKLVLQDKELSDRISKRALIKVQQYTWQKRAEKIIKFIK